MIATATDFVEYIANSDNPVLQLVFSGIVAVVFGIGFLSGSRLLQHFSFWKW